MSDLIDIVHKQIQDQYRQVLADFEQLKLDSETAGFAQELRQTTFSEANTEKTSITGVALLWISDGRKDGEGAGLGTGVVAVLDQGQSPAEWLRTSDYTLVVI